MIPNVCSDLIRTQPRKIQFITRACCGQVTTQKPNKIPNCKLWSILTMLICMMAVPFLSLTEISLKVTLKLTELGKTVFCTGVN